MDTKLKDALEFANYRQTLNNQLHKLKIQSDGGLIFAYGGGKFIINQQLICFIDYMVRQDMTSGTILDNNNIPVFIEDTTEFLTKISETYFSVTYDYLREYQRIKKLRNVKSILDIGDA